MKQKIIVAAIVLVVGGMFATGVLNWNKFWGWCRHYYYRGRGEAGRVTQIGKKPPVNDPAAANQCRANLRMIENAKRKVAQQKGVAIGQLTWDDLKREFPGGKIPRCPAGGEYILNDIGVMPQCTIGSNATAPRDDDHIVINY